MKNMEKYTKEILEYAGSANDRMAVRKSTGEPRSCSDDTLKCEDCIRYVNNCCEDEPLHKWAMAEYVEKPKISAKDRVFLDYIRDVYNFVVRNKEGKLFLYGSKPWKTDNGAWVSISGNIYGLRCFDIDFPMIKREDEEPWLIEDLKKLEVCDEY